MEKVLESSLIILIPFLPFSTDIDKVFHDFWTMGKTVKQIVSTHLEEDNNESHESRREVREILAGIIALRIEGGPSCFNAIQQERSGTMPLPRT